VTHTSLPAAQRSREFLAAQQKFARKPYRAVLAGSAMARGGGRALMLLTVLLGAWVLLWRSPPPVQNLTPRVRASVRAVAETATDLPPVHNLTLRARASVGAVSPAAETAAGPPAGLPTYWVPAADSSASAVAVDRCGPAPGPAAQQEPLALLAKPATCAASLAGDAASACRLAASRIGTRGELLVIGASDGGGTAEELAALARRLLLARRAVGSRLLLVATSAEQAELASQLNIGWWRLPPAPSAHGATSALWRAAAALLRSGLAVVVSSDAPGRPGALWAADPFAHLSRDVDLEAVQLGEIPRRRDRGSVVGTSDPPMGWSAYAQSMAMPLVDPAVASLHPTGAAAELAAAYARALAAGPALDPDAVAAAGALDGAADPSLWAAWQLTRLALQPAHDAETRPGASFRALPRVCFAADAASAVAIQPRASDARSVGVAMLGPEGAAAAARAAQEALAASHALDAGSRAEPETSLPTRDAAGPPMVVRQGVANEILTSLDWRAAEQMVLSGQGCRAPNASAGGFTPG